MSSSEDSKEPNVKEGFSEHFQLQQIVLEQQIDRIHATSLTSRDRADVIDRSLADIASLSRQVSDVSSSIPPYDQRIYSEALRGLSQRLQEARLSQAPRRKFAFKKPSSSQASSTSPFTTHTTGPHQQQTRETPSTQPRPSPNTLNHIPFPPSKSITPITSDSKTLTLISLSSTHLNPPSPSPLTSISLICIRNSFIDLSAHPHPSATLTLTEITHSLLICGSVAGAAHITRARNSVLLIRSRQVRMHECMDCVMYLWCSGRPIIEDCSGIKVAPLSAVFDSPSSPSSPSSIPPPPTQNQWSHVDDFHWLKAALSPNWSVLLPAERVPDGYWRAIAARFGSSTSDPEEEEGGKGGGREREREIKAGGLETILKAVGVGGVMGASGG